MALRSIVIFLLAAFAVIAGCQDQFPYVPDNYSAFAGMRQLKLAEGPLETWLKNQPPSGPGPNRRLLAESVYATIMALQSSIPRVFKQVSQDKRPDWLKRCQAAVLNLEALLPEFRREFHKMGADSNMMHGQIHNAQLLLVQLKLTNGQNAEIDAFPDVSDGQPKNATESGETPDDQLYVDIPENHWFFETFALCKQLGLTGLSVGRNHWYRRWEMADEVDLFIHQLPNISAQTLSDHYRRSPLRVCSLSQGLRRSVNEFRNEIILFGGEPEELLAKADAFSNGLKRELHITDAQLSRNAGGAFEDVPADHWAARAVTELKEAGILVGYPDKLFH